MNQSFSSTENSTAQEQKEKEAKAAKVTKAAGEIGEKLNKSDTESLTAIKAFIKNLALFFVAKGKDLKDDGDSVHITEALKSLGYTDAGMTPEQQVAKNLGLTLSSDSQSYTGEKGNCTVKDNQVGPDKNKQTVKDGKIGEVLVKTETKEGVTLIDEINGKKVTCSQ